MNKRQKLVQQQFLNNEEAVIKRLEDVYEQSLTEINDKVKNLSFSIGKLKKEYDWMEPDDPEKEKVKSMIQSKIYQKQYQEQLQKQVEGVLEQMHTKSFLSVSDYLDECYTDGFIGTIFDAHGQGVPFMAPIDQESMVRAVQLESKISQGLYTRLGEDVDLLKKKITAEVSRSIATGRTFAQTAQALAGYTNIGYNNAARIARTEGHRIQTTATMDAMTAAKENGADVVKQWDSTLDARTRHSHAVVDGEIRELNKAFSNGLSFPGDPHGRAAEVVNCRCALLQRARWAIGDGFTKFNGITGQIESFDSPKSYDEFKTAFFSKENQQYTGYVQQMQEKYGTKNFAKVLDKMSEREYKHYSGLLANNPIYRKKKTDEGVFSTFNFTKADSVRPESIVKELNKSEVGSEALKYLENENVPVRLCYGVDHDEDVSGKYDPIDDEIFVYCDVTKTTKETALTVIHEATHRKLGATGTFDEEVECFKAEMMHQKGELTNSDIDDIIALVKRNYPDLIQG